MIYLKKFSTENDYVAYRDGKDYLKPNVSLLDDNGKVYYNFTPPPPDSNGYEYVDLGLPSKTLWATMNVGASKASDAGLYFQWGDTQGYTKEEIEAGKKKFASDWSDYKWKARKGFSKYNTAGDALELEDDAAHANMGGSWHMPTPTQISELLNTAYTTNTWTTQDGVNGRLFTSKSDPSKSIFIPAAGVAWEGSLGGRGGYGNLWSSLLNTGDVYGGQSLYFGSGGAYLYGNNFRCGGCSVRGVLG